MSPSLSRPTSLSFLFICLLAALHVRSAPPTPDYDLLFADEFDDIRVYNRALNAGEIAALARP